MSKKQQNQVERSALLSLSFIAFAVNAFTANFAQAKKFDDAPFLGEFSDQEPVQIETTRKDDLGVSTVPSICPKKAKLSKNSSIASGEIFSLELQTDNKLVYPAMNFAVTERATGHPRIEFIGKPERTNTLMVGANFQKNKMILVVSFVHQGTQIECRYSRPQQN